MFKLLVFFSLSPTSDIISIPKTPEPVAAIYYIKKYLKLNAPTNLVNHDLVSLTKTSSLHGFRWNINNTSIHSRSN